MTIRQINQTLDEGLSLKLLTQAYSEISAIKLKRIRAGIERNRQFSTELSEVFKVIKKIAHKRRNFSEIINKMVAKNGRTVSILITSNLRFYGEINTMLLREFMLGKPDLNTDRIIIGKIGIEYLKIVKYAYPYTPLIFKTDLPQDAELSQLVNQVKDYQQILVSHPRFKTVLVQIPTVTDVTQSALESSHIPKSQGSPFADTLGALKMAFSNTPVDASDEPSIDYILEPEIDKMLQFFDSQIITLLLEETFLESELSRTASRLINMDNAETNANQFISQTKRELAQARKSINNNQLIQTFGSFMMWRQHANKQT